MKGGRREGGRLAFSSALEEFVLAAKLSLLFFFHSLSFHQAHSLSLSASPSFPLLITIFPISQTLHCSLFLCPPSIFSFSLYYFLAITFHLSTCPLIQDLMVVLSVSEDRVNKPPPPWSYLTLHWGHSAGHTHT